MPDQTTDFRVGILDDHRSFAEAMCLALNAADGFECVGSATSVEECLGLVQSQRPDVMLVDYQLFDSNGIECASRINQAGIDVRLVLLTAHASPDLQQRSLTAGIEQVLSKDAPLQRILDAVRTAAADSPLDLTTADRVVFSDRQRDVLDLMGEGLDPAAIATRLYISLHTARGHVKDVMKLLGASTQLSAVTQAQRQGYLVPPRAAAPEEV